MPRILFALALAAYAGEAVASDSAAGLWAQVDDASGRIRTEVRIVERDGVYSGRIVRFNPEPDEPPNPLCEACPGHLHNRPIVGLTFLRGFRRAGPVYSGGLLLDPESGSTYQGTMTLSDDGRSLVLRGYVVSPLFGRSQVWRRLD
ncbi:DUF2147 domain-containing protein [Prosthecomicrobium sp. N25]|uniref:DUF2147 domain-containing protein n=1 Tax=Prosthecomicrobium sp. N25 TaxID=3129254 RepID=UPI00307895AD